VPVSLDPKFLAGVSQHFPRYPGVILKNIISASVSNICVYGPGLPTAETPPALPTATPLDFNPKKSPWSRPDPRGNFGGPLKAICLKMTMKEL